jgi:hypothetical protein
MTENDIVFLREALRNKCDALVKELVTAYNKSIAYEKAQLKQKTKKENNE